MKRVIKALDWLSKLIWVVIILLPITFGLSAEKLLEQDVIDFGEAIASLSDNEVCISMPLYINNTGYYDFSDFNLTTVLKDAEGRAVAQGETFILTIHAGSRVDVSHNVYVNMDKLSEDMEHLLLNDASLDLNASLSLRFAYVLRIGLHTNLAVPWGAPLHDLRISRVRYDSENEELSMDLTFENHAPFTVEGKTYVIICNNMSEIISNTILNLEVTPENPTFIGSIEIPVDVSKITQNGYVELLFETDHFTIGPIRKEWGLGE